MVVEYSVVTRSSQLALKQTSIFVEKFLSFYPERKIKVVSMQTEGDRSLLSVANLKYAFSLDLEKALLSKDAHMAVHSLKDMSVFENGDLKIAAFLQRACAQDVFVSKKFRCLSELPDGSVIGTSSARRCSQIRIFNPSFKVKLCRGNILTRLEKLNHQQYDAIILASAGLERLSIDRGFFLEKLSLESFTPACGQGVIAIQVGSHMITLIKDLKVINHDLTFCCVDLERKIVAAFGGGCSMPIGVHVSIVDFQYQVLLFLGDVMGKDSINRRFFWPVGQKSYSDLISEAVNDVLSQGGQFILDRAKVFISKGFHD